MCHAESPSNFSSLDLKAALQAHAPDYLSALPFPHAIIESLFPERALRALAAEVPETMLASGCVPGAAACYRKRGVHYRKSELHDEAQGPYTRALFATLRTRSFVQFLERLSGVERLIPDPGFQGSGVHLTGPGGILKVHHDFNFMRCMRTESAGDYGGGRTRVSYSECRRGASAEGGSAEGGSAEGSSSTGNAGYRRLHRRLYVSSGFQAASCRRASTLPIMKAYRESHVRISS